MTRGFSAGSLRYDYRSASRKKEADLSFCPGPCELLLSPQPQARRRAHSQGDEGGWLWHNVGCYRPIIKVRAACEDKARVVIGRDKAKLNWAACRSEVRLVRSIVPGMEVVRDPPYI